MRYYVKFDGKDAVPEWLEDVFECISDVPQGCWAFYYHGSLYQGYLSPLKDFFLIKDMDGKANLTPLIDALNKFAKGLDELRIEVLRITIDSIKVRFYYDN